MRRIFFAVLASSAIVAPALAEDGGATPAPPSAYALTVTPQEAQTIWGAVGQLPYAQVAPLMDKLRSQITEQSRPKRADAPVPAPVDPVPAK